MPDDRDDEGRVLVCTVAHVPPDLVHAWLQHLRDFDTAHAGCHFEIVAEAPSMTVGEMLEALRVEPALSLVGLLQGRG